jgi:hypothetical protein
MRSALPVLLLVAFLASLPRAAVAAEAPPSKPSATKPVVGALLFGIPWAASWAISMRAMLKHAADCGSASDAADAADAASYRSSSPDAAARAIQADVNQIVVCGEQPAERSLWVPLAGPWLTLSAGSWSGAQRVALAADGVAQAAGIGLLVWGIVEGASGRGDATGEAAKLEVRPLVGASNGVSLVARF